MGLRAVGNPAAGGQPGSFTSLTATSLTVNGGISVASGNIIGIGTQQAYMFGDASAAEVGSSTNSYKVVVGGGLRAEFTPTGLAVTGSISAGTLEIVGGIQSLASVTITKDGSDSIGSGPLMQVRNAGATRSWVQQLSASNNLDWWHLDGSWTKYMTLSTAGLAVTGSISATDYIAGAEQTPPSAPAANGYRIFAQDNGAGKTQLMVIFASGAAQQIAIEP